MYKEQTEDKILQKITSTLTDLESATYGRERSDGHLMPPNASQFYKSLKQLFDLTDVLIETYHPVYISANNYNIIYDTKRTMLLELDVFKDTNKKLGETYLTYELEKYLMKINCVFDCIISYCKNKII